MTKADANQGVLNFTVERSVRSIRQNLDLIDTFEKRWAHTRCLILIV